MQSKLVTTSGAARILKVSEATVRQLEKRGVLHAARTSGNARIFDAEELQRLAEQRELVAER